MNAHERTWLADRILTISGDKTPAFTRELCALLGVPTPGVRRLAVAAQAPDYEQIELRAYGPLSTDGPPVHQRILERALREVRADGMTPMQVAATLHALADRTLQEHMLSNAVADLAIAPLAWQESPDPPSQVHGLGRFFHGLGDRIERDVRRWGG